MENDGSYRYKARIVAKGFSQIEGIDYKETFAPVTRLSSLRTLIAHATKNDWDMIHEDVKQAYTYGVMDEEVYMQQPKGYDDGSGKVCKLI